MKNLILNDVVKDFGGNVVTNRTGRVIQTDAGEREELTRFRLGDIIIQAVAQARLREDKDLKVYISLAEKLTVNLAMNAATAIVVTDEEFVIVEEVMRGQVVVIRAFYEKMKEENNGEKEEGKK